MQFKRNWSHIGMEIEKACGTGSQPLGNVFGIRQGRAQGYDSNVPLQLWWDISHARADHLQDRLQRIKFELDV